MKKIIFLVLIISCKTQNNLKKESALNSHIKFEYAVKKRNNCKTICKYINIKITNNNAVGVYLPLIMSEFTFGRALENKDFYFVSGGYFDVTDSNSVDDNEHTVFGKECYIKKNKDKRLNKPKNKEKILLKTLDDDMEYIFSKIDKNNINYSDEYILGARDFLYTIKYEETFFIQANNYIEIMAPIDYILNENKEIKNLILSYDNSENVDSYKTMIFPENFFIHDSKKLIEIPIKYPKKILDYHLVRRIKIKDTILNIR